MGLWKKGKDCLRLILSDSATGTGPNFVSPYAIVLNAAETVGYVADSSISALIQVDLSTGDRTILSDSSIGMGPELLAPRSVELNSSESSVYVMDQYGGALIEINLSSGNRTIKSK